MSSIIKKPFLPLEGYNTNDPKAKFITFVLCIVLGTIVLIFFLLYINMLFATILSKTINLYTWRKHKTWIDIGSVSIVPLLGLIYVKNLKIVTKNFAFYVLDITIDIKIISLKRSFMPNKSLETSFCDGNRINIKLDGIEVFIYNSSIFYDSLHTFLSKIENGGFTGDVVTNIESNDKKKKSVFGSDIGSISKFLLPIGFYGNVGAICIGNQILKYMPTISYKKLKGDLLFLPDEVSKYRLRAFFKDIQLTMPVNPDHTENELREVEKINWKLDASRYESRMRHIKNTFKAIFNKLFFRNDYNAFYTSEQSVEKRHIKWSGLSRYKYPDDNEYCRKNFLIFEYAKVQKIFETESLYAETFLKSASNARVVTEDSCDSCQFFDIVVNVIANDCLIQYGPWSDNERSRIQSAFFPPKCENLVVTNMDLSNQSSVLQNVIFYVKFKGLSKLRIPYREMTIIKESKRYDWFDVKFSRNSTLECVHQVLVNPDGNKTNIKISLNDMEIISSVLYAVILKCGECMVDIELEYPIIWNTKRTWSYVFNFKNSDLNPAPVHFTAITNLIADWNTVRDEENPLFVPIMHYINFSFDGVSCMFNNVNEKKYDDLDDELVKSFTQLKCPRLDAELFVPIENCSEKADLYYCVSLEYAKIYTSKPTRSNDDITFFTRSNEIGSCSLISFTGKYLTVYTLLQNSNHTFFDDNKKSSIINDVFYFVHVEVKLLGLRMIYSKCVGSQILSFFNNYFGGSDGSNESYTIETLIDLEIEDIKLFLPKKILSDKSNVQVYCNKISGDISMCGLYGYYGFSARKAYIFPNDEFVAESVNDLDLNNTREQVVIEDVNIKYHLFKENNNSPNNYFTNSTMFINKITSELSLESVIDLHRCLSIYSLDFTDLYAELYTKSNEYDLFSYKVMVDIIDIKIFNLGTVVRINLPDGLQLYSQNLASENYGEKLSIDIPSIIVRILAPAYPSLLGADSKTPPNDSIGDPSISWILVVFMETSLSLEKYYSIKKVAYKSLQLKYLKKADAINKVCKFAYDPTVCISHLKYPTNNKYSSSNESWDLPVTLQKTISLKKVIGLNMLDSTCVISAGSHSIFLPRYLPKNKVNVSFYPVTFDPTKILLKRLHSKDNSTTYPKYKKASTTIKFLKTVRILLSSNLANVMQNISLDFTKRSELECVMDLIQNLAIEMFSYAYNKPEMKVAKSENSILFDDPSNFYYLVIKQLDLCILDDINLCQAEQKAVQGTIKLCADIKGIFLTISKQLDRVSVKFDSTSLNLNYDDSCTFDEKDNSFDINPRDLEIKIIQMKPIFNAHIKSLFIETSLQSNICTSLPMVIVSDAKSFKIKMSYSAPQIISTYLTQNMPSNYRKFISMYSSFNNYEKVIDCLRSALIRAKSLPENTDDLVEPITYLISDSYLGYLLVNSPQQSDFLLKILLLKGLTVAMEKIFNLHRFSPVHHNSESEIDISSLLKLANIKESPEMIQTLKFHPLFELLKKSDSSNNIYNPTNSDNKKSFIILVANTVARMTTPGNKELFTLAIDELGYFFQISKNQKNDDMYVVKQHLNLKKISLRIVSLNFFPSWNNFNAPAGYTDHHMQQDPPPIIADKDFGARLYSKNTRCTCLLNSACKNLLEAQITLTLTFDEWTVKLHNYSHQKSRPLLYIHGNGLAAAYCLHEAEKKKLPTKQSPSKQRLLSKIYINLNSIHLDNIFKDSSLKNTITQFKNYVGKHTNVENYVDEKKYSPNEYPKGHNVQMVYNVKIVTIKSGDDEKLNITYKASDVDGAFKIIFTENKAPQIDDNDMNIIVFRKRCFRLNIVNQCLCVSNEETSLPIINTHIVSNDIFANGKYGATSMEMTVKVDSIKLSMCNDMVCNATSFLKKLQEEILALFKVYKSFSTISMIGSASDDTKYIRTDYNDSLTVKDNSIYPSLNKYKLHLVLSEIDISYLLQIERNSSTQNKNYLRIESPSVDLLCHNDVYPSQEKQNNSESVSHAIFPFSWKFKSDVNLSIFNNTMTEKTIKLEFKSTINNKNFNLKEEIDDYEGKINKFGNLCQYKVLMSDLKLTVLSDINRCKEALNDFLSILTDLKNRLGSSRLIDNNNNNVIPSTCALILKNLTLNLVSPIKPCNNNHNNSSIFESINVKISEGFFEVNMNDFSLDYTLKLLHITLISPKYSNSNLLNILTLREITSSHNMFNDEYLCEYNIQRVYFRITISIFNSIYYFLDFLEEFDLSRIIVHFNKLICHDTKKNTITNSFVNKSTFTRFILLINTLLIELSLPSNACDISNSETFSHMEKKLSSNANSKIKSEAIVFHNFKLTALYSQLMKISSIYVLITIPPSNNTLHSHIVNFKNACINSLSKIKSKRCKKYLNNAYTSESKSVSNYNIKTFISIRSDDLGMELNATPHIKLSSFIRLSNVLAFFTYIPALNSPSNVPFSSFTLNIENVSLAVKHVFSFDNTLNIALNNFSFLASNGSSIYCSVNSLDFFFRSKYFSSIMLLLNLWLKPPTLKLRKTNVLVPKTAKTSLLSSNDILKTFILVNPKSYFKFLFTIDRISLKIDFNLGISDINIGFHDLTFLYNAINSLQSDLNTINEHMALLIHNISTNNVPNSSSFNTYISKIAFRIVKYANRTFKVDHDTDIFRSLKVYLNLKNFKMTFSSLFECVLLAYMDNLNVTLLSQNSIINSQQKRLFDSGVSLGTLYVIISRKTLSAIKNIVTKVMSSLLELNRNKKGENCDTEDVISKSNNSKNNYFDFPPKRLLPQDIRTTFSFRVQFASLILLRLGFKDPNFVSVIVSNLNLSHLKRRGRNRSSDSVSFSLLKLNKNISRSFIDSDQFFASKTYLQDFLKNSKITEILTIPYSSLSLYYTVTLNDNQTKVLYVFQPKFSGEINTSFNIMHYNYLVVLFKLYKDYYTNNFSSSPSSSSSSHTTLLSDDMEHQDEALNLDEFDHVHREPKSLLQVVKNKSPSDMIFVAQKPVIFKPKLKLTGDATPINLVGLFGIDKQAIPELIYTYVSSHLTDFLENVNAFLSKNYEPR